MVLRLTSRSPRRPGFVVTVACASSRRLDASIGASEPHDFAVRFNIIRPARIRSPDAAASTASRSAFVTCARPSVGRDGERYRSDLGPLASEISEFQKFVARPSRRLPLQLDGILGNRLICPGRAKSVHPVLRAKTIFLLRSCRLPSRSSSCGKTRSNEGAAQRDHHVRTLAEGD